ncbi:hypothetical protein [Kitasatospora cathayae]|uniref:Uncharacterized protein n=1 Tax=Kitasatospora cathayae TaxID=3004092 RepID=A0ABY7Q032_9ACTN|nr:hypothetical protein [Kitasatospora sp. HUAS 3-15]WBP86042.1 hypothetical protein O1G21_09460 [Kitasatospora sp. HUAS 3-15]
MRERSGNGASAPTGRPAVRTNGRSGVEREPPRHRLPRLPREHHLATGIVPADPVAAKAEIAADWEKFFDPATPIAGEAELVQGGDMLFPVLQASRRTRGWAR